MNISGGKYKGQKIIVPSEKITRPTLSKVRMGVFNSLYSILGGFEGLTFLDVFAGSGIMGLEALSRGFSSVTAIELDKSAVDIIKVNYKKLGVNLDLKVGNSLSILPKLDKTFDVAYIDPPYASGIYDEAIELLKPIAKIVVLEHPKTLKLTNQYTIKQKKYGDKLISYLKYV